MAKSGAKSPYAGNAVLSFSAGGRLWSVSTPLVNTTPGALRASLTDLLPQLVSKAGPDLHPKKTDA